MEEVKKGFYSLKELAVYLDMSYVFVDQMVRAGNIKTVRMGGERKISKEEFDRIAVEGLEKLPAKADK